MRTASREDYTEHLKCVFPKISKVEFYDGIFQEDYERGWLLEEALKSDADWCISVDDDEIYEDAFVEAVPALMRPRNPEVFGYWTNWRTIWDKQNGEEYFRADDTFGGFSNYRMFRLIPGMEIASFHPEGHHCGSAPLIALENLQWTSLRVKHLGYDTPEQRQRKYDFYQKNDNFKDRNSIGHEDYRHLVDVNVVLKKYHAKNDISVILMVKNEADFMKQCLESIEPVAGEYVIVDTGSTDMTKEIVQDFAARSRVPVKLLDYPWCDNYSIPRNFGKEHATCRWCLHLDPDEKFMMEDLRTLWSMTEEDADGYVFHVVNYFEKPVSGQKVKYGSSESIRLFRNIPELYYTGILHETFDDALGAIRMRREPKITRSPVILHHYGYLRGVERTRGKMDYYEKLNNIQVEITEGKDPRPYFNLAMHYMNDNKKSDALRCFQKALEINPKFWHANQQMAILNLDSAIHYLTSTMGCLSDNHPFRERGEAILKYLQENRLGTVKVC
jgi:glycosyltransferase involved in cell wall biosynthesis